MTKLKHTIQVILGDWSDDSYGKSSTREIASNLSREEIEKAYKVATKILGFDFCETVCSKYENNILHKEELNILIKNGLTLDIIYNNIVPTDKYSKKFIKEAFDATSSAGLSLWIDDFVHIYWFIIKLGNKDFQYKILTKEQFPQINIGGYGLFF